MHNADEGQTVNKSSPEPFIEQHLQLAEHCSLVKYTGASTYSNEFASAR